MDPPNTHCGFLQLQGKDKAKADEFGKYMIKKKS